MSSIKELMSIYNTPIRWTNKHTCPEGYEWNKDGWIQTEVPLLQVTINMLPYMLTRYGEYKVLFQNLVALRYLNDKPSHVLISTLKNKFRVSYYRDPYEEEFNKAVKDAMNVGSIEEIKNILIKDIFTFYDIWFSHDCTMEGRKQIQAIIKQDYIAKSRNLMSISSKYITEKVASFADVSQYAVKKHWSELEFTKKDRTYGAVVEAIEYIKNNEEELSLKHIADVAGVSVKSIRNLIKDNRILKLE